jgi:hypothetical protein
MFEPTVEYEVTNQRTGEKELLRGYQVGVLALRVLERTNAQLPSGEIVDVSGVIAIEHMAGDVMICSATNWQTALVLVDELSLTAPEQPTFEELLDWVQVYLPWIQWIGGWAPGGRGARPPTWREYTAGVRLVGQSQSEYFTREAGFA